MDREPREWRSVAIRSASSSFAEVRGERESADFSPSGSNAIGPEPSPKEATEADHPGPKLSHAARTRDIMCPRSYLLPFPGRTGQVFFDPKVILGKRAATIVVFNPAVSDVKACNREKVVTIHRAVKNVDFEIKGRPSLILSSNGPKREVFSALRTGFKPFFSDNAFGFRLERTNS